MRKQRLELTWIGKDDRQHLEPRILLEDPTKSYHANGRVTENDLFDNRLIFGDNLLALRALESEYSGRIKCIFIDPPYNTGSAFTHYDDGVEHSLWLSLMRDRIEILHRLLSDDGSLWITIDDNEAHYLKIVCDDIFGRKNYVTSVVWEKDKGRRSDASFSAAHDYILIYAKNETVWGKVRNLLDRTPEQLSRYRNPDNDPRGPWLQGDNGTAKSSSEGSRFPVTLPSGRVVTPPPSRGWSFSKETLAKARDEQRVYFGANGDGMPIIKRYLSEVQGGVVPRTWWPADEAGHNQEAKRDHLNKLLFGIEPFPTPKPERLLQRILSIATNPGDLVLDSFAGSGTTGAVAHKMGRRWIMIELGEHCHTHIIPRLKKVIDGEDPGGVTDGTEWKGGGGFRYYKLASSLLEKDKWGNWVIQSDYNPAMLAEAVCKLMGFTYTPSEHSYWMHGYSSERDFIYVTTQSLTRDQLRAISEEVGDDRSLLVCCKAFNAKPDAFPNLTIKKIPLAVLRKCEWGRDDYSLTVQNLPEAKAELIDAQPKPSPKRRAVKPQADLFAEKE
ncbi:site-specific DNA-methyltransferase [Paraburkholderia azotifigens]|uniref:site-specific DNA-methyltransferase (adenine-specific) n=1 Tax=Paraburkholderia azotifigens TaxID=2057004 RepID=A0A5C6VLY3_9BURK|nr:site-specific DNA-methyltransferase [Paraburkholderia azotifigens]TXC85536.1 site-specific DNA-methyltransferase [Paraburkholderia azotifigens]